MIELDLQLLRKARIWFDELPDVGFESTQIYKKQFTDASSLNPRFQRVAIELKIPVGARIIYGLLGAELNQPSIDNSLLVEIHTTEGLEKHFEKSLLLNSTEVYKGLPSQYLNSIVNGVETILDKIEKSSGKMVFKYAAHSIVGSNEIIFNQLSKIVLAFFFSNKNFTSDEDYINLIVKYLD